MSRRRQAETRGPWSQPLYLSVKQSQDYSLESIFALVIILNASLGKSSSQRPLTMSEAASLPISSQHFAEQPLSPRATARLVPIKSMYTLPFGVSTVAHVSK